MIRLSVKTRLKGEILDLLMSPLLVSRETRSRKSVAMDSAASKACLGSIAQAALKVTQITQTVIQGQKKLSF